VRRIDDGGAAVTLAGDPRLRAVSQVDEVEAPIAATSSAFANDLLDLQG